MAPKRDIAHHLADMLQAIGEIEQLIAGKTLAQYKRDFATRRAVERCIEIVSEAARGIPAAHTNRHPEIPWKSVKGIGNVLRHEYHHVADGIIYQVAVRHVPALKAAVEAIQAMSASQAAGKPERAAKSAKRVRAKAPGKKAPR